MLQNPPKGVLKFGQKLTHLFLECEDDAQTPIIEAVVTELAQQVDLSNIAKFNVVRANLFDSAKRALNRKRFDPCHKVSVKFMDDVGSSEGTVDLGGPKREFFTLLLHSLLYESVEFQQ